MSAPAPKLSLFRQRLRSTFAQSPSTAVVNQGNAPAVVDSVPTPPDISLATPSQASAPSRMDLPQAPEPVPAALSQTSTPPVEISTDQRLDILDSIISKLEAAAPLPPAEVVEEPTQESVLAPEQVVEPVSAPVAEQVTPTDLPAPEPVAPLEAPVVSPPPVHVSSLSKEAAPSVLAEQPVIEAGSGVQVVEYEPRSEMPVEVESFIQEIQDHQTEQPQEIVISDGQMQIQPAAIPKKSVIVLPITPETETEGAKKSSKWSVRWLVEWSRKLMKAFSGRIIYREVSTEN